MITRQLLVGTAVVAVLATGAFAQSSSSAPSSSVAASSGADQSSTASSSMMDSSAMSSQMSTASSQDSSMMSSAQQTTTTTATTTSRQPVQILSGYTTVDSDRLATKIIGQPVYDGKAKDSNNLGKIADLVLDENGRVAAVVVGVGGFLGLGEKQVAVDFGALQFVIADDNTKRYVLQTTKDELTKAPDFKTVEVQPASSAAASTASSAAPSTAVSSSSAAM